MLRYACTFLLVTYTRIGCCLRFNLLLFDNRDNSDATYAASRVLLLTIPEWASKSSGMLASKPPSGTVQLRAIEILTYATEMLACSSHLIMKQPSQLSIVCITKISALSAQTEEDENLVHQPT